MPQAAETVVRILESEGIEVAFGIPGAAINPVYKHLQDSNIRHYIARHEEGAVHAADGYCRASGKMALAICTSGPAATNMVTGLYTAFIDSIPLIAITGQAATHLFGKDAFQCVDIAKIAQSVTKATWCITDANQVAETLRLAFKVARSGRPGPVLIDLPIDVQMAHTEYDTESRCLPWVGPTPDEKDILRALDIIETSKEPVMLLGGGVILSGATNEFREFAEFLSIPVIMTYMGKGGLRHDHPLNAGHCGIQVGQPIGNEFLLGSDLVIGVGCRFTDRHTGKLDVYTRGRRFIHVDIDEAQIGKVIPADVSIVSDAKAALTSLLSEAKRRGIRREPSSRVVNLPKRRAELAGKTDSVCVPMKPQRLFHEINHFFPDDSIFTTGCGVTQIWSGQLQNITFPRKYLPSGGAGTLGYELPAAIGAKVACPEVSCVAVVGDAGLLFMLEELGMAQQHRIPIVVIVVNNGYLGLIRQNQKYAYGYEYAVNLWEGEEGSEGADNVLLARGFGAEAERVFEPTELQGAFERAMKANARGVSYLIDVIVERECDCSMGASLDAIQEYI